MGKTGLGTIRLLDIVPQRIGETNTYRFRVAGDFAADGTQSVQPTSSTTPGVYGRRGASAADQALHASDPRWRPRAGSIRFTPSVNVVDPAAPLHDRGGARCEHADPGRAGHQRPAGPEPPGHRARRQPYRFYVDASEFLVADTGTVTRRSRRGSHGLERHPESQHHPEFHRRRHHRQRRRPGRRRRDRSRLAQQARFLDVTFGFPSGKTRPRQHPRSDAGQHRSRRRTLDQLWILPGPRPPQPVRQHRSFR